jgi:hypothetical protein
MRKMFLVILIFIALRIMPKRDMLFADLMTIFLQAILATNTNSSKTDEATSNIAKIGLASKAVATKLASQAGSTAALAAWPSPQTGACLDNLYGLTTSDQTGGAASHTHTLPFYNPEANHTHYTGIDTQMTAYVNALNAWRTALINAGVQL